MSKVTELQKAIEELAPNEREEIRNWLHPHDTERERESAEAPLRGLKTGEGKISQTTVAERPHRVTIVLSVLAIIMSVFAFGVSWYSARLSTTTTRITEEKAAPLVYDTEALLRKQPLTTNSTLYVAVQLKNQGETAAYHIQTHYNLQLVPEGQELKKDYEGEGSDFNEEPRLATQDWTQVNYRRTQPLSAEDLSRINNGNLQMWFFGMTTYEDYLRQKRTIAWCWVYKPELQEFWRCD